MISQLAVLWLLNGIALSFLSYKLLLMRSAKKRLRKLPSPTASTIADASICVQLPLYNEPEHAASLIGCIANLKWPNENLEIQVLDDSTDQTSAIVENKICQLKETAPLLKIHHIRRANRQGFKAGALNNGLKQTSADFIAIFDCDFRPNSDFLLRVMDPEFLSSPKVAAVQAAWGFTNVESSFLTRTQNILLNTHFFIEHFSRYQLGLNFNFNGTAGVWRRSAIDALGGWSSESVAEDLLLSYKAQMQGFSLIFRDEVVCPSELPWDIGSFLVQQRRWAKGGAQVLRLLGKDIFKQRSWSFFRRLDSLLHLSGYGISSVVAVGYLLSPYWIYLHHQINLGSTQQKIFVILVDVVLWSMLFATFMHLFARKRIYRDKNSSPSRRILTAGILFLNAPILMSLTAFSYWQGYFAILNRKKALFFARTPKNPLASEIKFADRLALVTFGFFALACAAQAAHYGFYAAATLLVLHFFALLTLWPATRFQGAKLRAGKPLRTNHNLRKKPA